MLLEGRNAIVYGAAGGIGAAVSRAFAREGATVHLCGRTQETLDEVAEEIRGAGGSAEVSVVDALDEAQVTEHAEKVGDVDISMNLITHPYTHGTPLWEMDADDYLAPIEVAAKTTFITAKAAVNRMIPRKSGVILAFGGPGDRAAPDREYYLGGTQTAFDAIETFRRQLSVEAGKHGIRFVTLESGGVAETLPEFDGKTNIVEMIEGQSLLGRTSSLEEIGQCAAFAASDYAKGMTAATLNVSSGSLID